MTNINETNKSEDLLLLHDLRRFLHNARDQQDTLIKISKVMSRASGQMQERETATNGIIKSLRHQVDKGVNVCIDTDLNAHIVQISKAISPLLSSVDRIANTFRNFATMVAMVSFVAGFAGSLLGVIAALRLL